MQILIKPYITISDEGLMLSKPMNRPLHPESFISSSRPGIFTTFIDTAAFQRIPDFFSSDISSRVHLRLPMKLSSMNITCLTHDAFTSEMTSSTGRFTYHLSLELLSEVSLQALQESLCADMFQLSPETLAMNPH